MTRLLSLYSVTRPQWVNSPWPSDAKWQHRSGSTLAQEMAHFLMAPSHYLNQSSLIISEVLWPSTEGNTVSQKILKISIFDMNVKIDNLRLQPHLPCVNESWFKVLLACRSREAIQSWCLLWTHSMDHFDNLWSWCLVVTCWRKHIPNLSLNIHVNLTKSTWKYLDKYQVLYLQVQVSTKYFWISKCQVQISAKYSEFCIKYQVQVLYLTPTLSDDKAQMSDERFNKFE